MNRSPEIIGYSVLVPSEPPEFIGLNVGIVAGVGRNKGALDICGTEESGAFVVLLSDSAANGSVESLMQVSAGIRRDTVLSDEQDPLDAIFIEELNF